MRNFLENKGYKTSSFMEMAQVYRKELANHGITLNEEEFNYLTSLICRTKNNFVLTKHYSSKKPTEQAQVPAGLIIGFVKCLAGGLLCIILAPVA